MKTNLSQEWVFPFVLFAFSAVGVSYVNIVFNANIRWLALLGLALALLIRGKLFSLFDNKLIIPVFPYLSWCFATVIWSEVPLLSFEKSFAVVFTAVTFIGGGMAWSRAVRSEHRLLYLLPVALLALLAGTGQTANSLNASSGDLVIYQGLTGNPNFLSVLATMMLPLGLYYGLETNRNRANYWIPIAGLIGIVASLVLLWITASRASMLCALAIGAAYAMSISAGRALIILTIAITITVGAGIAVPAAEEGVYERFVVKGETGDDIFASRRTNWAETYDAAVKGGAFGLGYGVSAGEKEFTVGLEAINYGREKGNSQLAIWEETGQIGLMLYSLIIFQILFLLPGRISTLHSRNDRIQATLVMGVTVGLIFQSIFEAWWSSPGSIEGACFWASLGVVWGIVDQDPYTARVRRPSSLASRLN